MDIAVISFTTSVDKAIRILRIMGKDKIFNGFWDGSFTVKAGPLLNQASVSYRAGRVAIAKCQNGCFCRSLVVGE